MKLPNSQNLVIDLNKLRGYCLNPQHPKGKDKAKRFDSILGITAKDTEELAEILRLKALTADVTFGIKDHHGQRYTMDFPLTRQGNTALVRSAWIIKSGEDFPRLTTCYILKQVKL